MKYFALLLTSLQLFATPLSHKIPLSVVEFAKPKQSIPFTGFYRIEKQCKLLFKDLGAELTEDSGFYLSSNSVKLNSGKVFGKWRDILKHPKNTKLIEIFEANLASNNMNELFSFPREVHYLKEGKGKTVLIFLDYTIPSAMQVREILNFSLRGYNVSVVDFYSKEQGKYFPTWEKCKKIADSAYNSLSGDIILYGKSFGSAPAAYLATKHPKSPLILDRAFSSMNHIADSYLLEGFINENYSYPVKSLIQKISQKPLIISSETNDTFFDHGKDLFESYRSSHKNREHDTLFSKCFISTRGGHYSSFLNKGESSWFSYEEAQRQLNTYLQNCDFELFIP